MSRQNNTRRRTYLTIYWLVIVLLFAGIAILWLEVRVLVRTTKELGMDLIVSNRKNSLLNEIGDADARTIGQRAASCKDALYCRRLPVLECLCFNETSIKSYGADRTFPPQR
jgi:hypothetical protein